MTIPCKYDSEIEAMKKKIDDMHQIICGNGKWGMVHHISWLKWAVVILVLRFVFDTPLTTIIGMFTR